MFTVYKITNKINNKSYIGSSIRVEKRWREHINCSKNPNDKKYNYPLYRSFRKYGVENFVFKVIKDDFSSIEEMQDYERQMIIFYNSLVPNGYNQTLNTSSNNSSSIGTINYIKKISQKCAKVDKKENILEIYSSYHEAAKKNSKNENYDEATRVRQVCKGKASSCFEGKLFRDLDENGQIIHQDIKSYKGKKKIIAINASSPDEEIYFDSILQASKLLPSDRGSISKCLQGNTRYSVIKGYILREVDLEGNIVQNNINIEDKINEFQNKNPLINGVRHTIPEWCKIYNIKPGTVNYRIRNGWNIIDAIITPVKGR